METSIFLAKVIGLVSIISVTAVLFRYKDFTLEEEAIKNPLFIWISGFVFLVLGSLLIVSHSVWTFDWRLVITILGWLVFLKGVCRIFFPSAVRLMTEKKKHNRLFIFGEIVVLMAGLYLLYYGFIVY